MTQTIEMFIDQTTEEKEVISSVSVETNTQIPSLIRTYKQGVFELVNGAWGKYIAPTIDPNANVVELSEEHFSLFELNENIYQIPSSLWSAWIELCFYYSDIVNKNVEVSVRILRSEHDPSVYRFLIPLQEVGKGSVRANNFNKSIDLITGEEIESYPPVGWIPVGSSHSHNTMDAFFSPTDDRYELADPGLHIVVGSINKQNSTYNFKISVTANNRRFIISDPDQEKRIIDVNYDHSSHFHSQVKEYISTQSGEFFKENEKHLNHNRLLSDSVWVNKKQKHNRDNWMDENTDPFFVGNENLTSHKSLKLWELDSLVQEYIDEHETNISKLSELYDTLGVLMDITTDTIDQHKGFFGEGAE